MTMLRLLTSLAAAAILASATPTVAAPHYTGSFAGKWSTGMNDNLVFSIAVELEGGYLQGGRYSPVDPSLDLRLGDGNFHPKYYMSDINNNNDLTGAIYQGPGDSSSTSGSIVRYTDAGGVEDLGTLGGSWAHGLAINDAGTVVGRSLLTGDDNYQGIYHAVRSTADGTLEDLGTLGGDWSQAVDINEAGQIVGSATTADGARRAFRYSDATGMVDLGLNGSDAAAISSTGSVAGTYVDPVTGRPGIFLYTDAGGTILVEDSSFQGDRVWISGMNDAEQIVGTSRSGVRNWIWDDGVLYDLAPLIEPIELFGYAAGLNSVIDIDESGRILASVYLRGCENCYDPFFDVFLTPDSPPPVDAPAPGALALFAVGTGLLLGGRRRTLTTH